MVLAVPDEDALLHHADLDHFADEYGVVFTEPDLDDEATAYANVCDGSRYTSLPLAGRVTAMT